MHESYKDITSRLGEPVWWDANATPRYDKFHPDYCPDIYSNRIFLLRIRCQSCGKVFDVEMHDTLFEVTKNPKKLHYGDPPAHGCVGDTMNCEDEKVLEVWSRSTIGKWKRLRKLEGKTL